MKLQEKESKCPAKHHFAYKNPRISEEKLFEAHFMKIATDRLLSSFTKKQWDGTRYNDSELYFQAQRGTHKKQKLIHTCHLSASDSVWLHCDPAKSI